jgi:hypothetical protein
LLFNTVAQAFRDAADKTVSERVGEDNDETGSWTVPTFGTEEVDKAFASQDWKLRDLKETVADAAKSFLELERKEREGVNGA